MQTIEATYNALAVPSFCQGNPLCEALPPLPIGRELVMKLRREPKGNFSDDLGSQHLGFYEASSLLSVNFPRLHSTKVALGVYSMIYNMYAKTFPGTPEFVKSICQIDKERFNEHASLGLQCDAMTLLAWSGMGKTTLISAVLQLLPQSIRHTEYQGRAFLQTQVVWLSVDAPLNGSPKGFLLNIAQALDEVLNLEGKTCHYEQMRGASVETMKVHIARALKTHCVGLLHVDDVQRWGEGDIKARTMSVSMLVGLANTIGCALLLSGTPAAVAVLQTNFESSRRANRRSAITLMTPEKADDPFFKGLIDYLFQYQIALPKVSPTDEIREVLLELTAGIPGVITSLYAATQETALLLNQPLSAQLFQRVMKEDFGLVAKATKELRKMRKKKGADWSPELERVIRKHLGGTTDDDNTADAC